MSAPIVQERILAYLAEHPHATAREVAESLKTSRQHVHQVANAAGITLARTNRPHLTLTRYACPDCGVEMWGAPGLTVLCGQRHDKGGLTQLREVASPAPKKPRAKAK